MNTDNEIISLNKIEYLPYLDEQGLINEKLLGKIGIYAIFDQQKILQYVGYSRDIYLSLKQHLVRQPHNCYWLKTQTINRPNRTILEATKQAWIEENGLLPIGNGEEETKWNHPIDAKQKMTPEEQEKYADSDELNQIKLLKNIARRVEAEINQQLEQRGVKMDLRFNPKLKEQGLLDLK